jgi:hypothetical protein
VSLAQTNGVNGFGYYASRKDPSSTLLYQFDWSKWLMKGESITQHSLTIENALITNTTSDVDNKIFGAYVSSGVVGTYAKLRCSVTTSKGRQDIRTIYIPIETR